MSKVKHVPYPVGLVVKEVRMMNDSELEEEGWENGWGDYPVVIVFNDGSKIYASQDPEGNGPGCIFGFTSDGTSVMVSPLDDDMIAENQKAQ